MSYAYIDYKDEDDIYASYSQKELEVREEYLKMIEGNSTELIYEPKDFRETNPEVYKKLIGSVSNFKDSFIVYIKRIGDIFFTVDPYDLIPLAVDLMDHYMNLHRGENLPFDPTSGRSSTGYMDKIRSEESIQPFLASETLESSLDSPTPASIFYEKIHSVVKSKQLDLSRIYQIDVTTARYLKPGLKQKLPFSEDYDPDEGYEEITVRVCTSAEGKPFPVHAHRDYDLNSETFQSFLADLKRYARVSKSKPILLLISRNIKAISLDVIYYCEKNGIILCAFPAYSKYLEPLSRRSIPMMKKKFDEVFAEKSKSESSLNSAEAIADLMKSTAEQVQSENVLRVERDFRECLRLHECLKLGSESPEDGVGLDLNVTNPSAPSTSQQPEMKRPKKKKARVDDGELNELMFAQVGPLKESDYYYY